MRPPRRRRLRRAVLPAAAALMSCALLAPVSSAALPGRSFFGIGISDDQAFQAPAAATRALWYSRAAQVGSSAVRIGVTWSVVAPDPVRPGFNASNPADPQYSFGRLDAAVRGASARHQLVMLMIFHAPSWAEGPSRPATSAIGPGSWYPNSSALGAFARALALRYSGHFRDPLGGHRMLPRVRYYQAWNEPNLSIYLAPQWGRTTSGAYVALSPIIYRGLLNAVYSAVKHVARSDQVFAAGTAPFGDPPGQYNAKVGPATFLEGLFCLNSALRRVACVGPVAHLDGLDHHTYSPPLYHASQPADISTPDLGRIWRIVRAARRAHTVLPAGAKPLWITELGAAATPPDLFHLALQAHYVALDLYELWSEGVSRVFWFPIADPLVQPGDPAANGGLYFSNAAPKPAAIAYAFPFVAVPAGTHVFAVWGRAPRRGTVSIERRAAGRWNVLRRVSTTRGGIFYFRLHTRAVPLLRATMGGAASLPWRAGT